MAGRFGVNAAVLNRLDGVVYASEEQAARWIASGDWINSTIGDTLRVTARERGNAPAFISNERTISFAELDQESEQAGAALLALGLQPGDRVIVQLGTHIETAVALVGLYKAGLIPVCAIPQYRDVEIGQLIRQSGARAHLVQADFDKFDLPNFAGHMRNTYETLEYVITVRGNRPEVGPSLYDMIQATPLELATARLRDVPVGPGDVLSFQLSGGTTGVPKIIPRYHAEYLGHMVAGMRRFGFTDADRMIWPLPLLHNAAQIFAMIPVLALGSSTVLMPKPDTRRFLELIEQHAVTHAISIGPVAAQLLQYPDLKQHDLSMLRMFATMSNAEALEAHIGVPCVNFYGITEGLLLSGNPGDTPTLRHGSNGFSGSADTDIKLVDPETGADLPPGVEGELAFRGPSSLRGYYGSPDATAEVLDKNGFFRSGDLMRPVIENGLIAYSFQGRTRDNVNRGGEKIGCEEVEGFVARHPDIAEARLVAMPDPLYGEKGCLFVIPRPGAQAPSIAILGAFLLEQGLAKFKCPERIETIFEFPVTRVGKLDRMALRKIIRETIEREATGAPM